jgi:hypothetical protein
LYCRHFPAVQLLEEQNVDRKGLDMKDAYIQANGLCKTGKHHEIYLGNPCAPTRPGSRPSCASR